MKIVFCFSCFRSEIRKIMVLKFELLTFRRPPIKFLFFCSKFQNGGKKSCFFVGKKSICFLRIFSQNESRVFSLRSAPTLKFPFSVVFLSLQIRQVVLRKRTVRQRFYHKLQNRLFFLLCLVLKYGYRLNNDFSYYKIPYLAF